MLWRYAAAIVLIFGTVFIHTACTALALGWLRSLHRRHWALRSAWARASALAGLVVMMSIAASIESGMWAGFYVLTGALDTLDDALYFSLVTFTTLGYGDVTLHGQWRSFSAMEAVNGVILFGWTTALIVAASQRLFLHRQPGEPDS